MQFLIALDMVKETNRRWTVEKITSTQNKNTLNTLTDIPFPALEDSTINCIFFFLALLLHVTLIILSHILLVFLVKIAQKTLEFHNFLFISQIVLSPFKHENS